MTFLQPILLLALPLVSLPILIHLINRNRYRTIPWAAMMFLLQARRRAAGMARLRSLLILLARMLALAGLIFAASRPMSGGWLGLTIGGTPDTTIIVLDRSASMEDRIPQREQSRRQLALQKLADLIDSTGAAGHLVLFESCSRTPLQILTAADLLELPETEATATTASLPLLMQAVTDYLRENQTGRTDVWICSDLRAADWDATSGRWSAIRSQLEDRDGVRICLLTWPEITPDNLAISVSKVYRRETAAGAELVMDLRVSRSTESLAPVPVPVTFEIDGARFRLDLELTGRELALNGHTIPVDRGARQGWGKVSLERDSNLTDNVYHFVYSEMPIRKTIIVSEDPQAARLFRIATATPADRGQRSEALVVSPAQALAAPWEEAALLIWQAPLPAGELRAKLTAFAAAGRSLMFFPPANPTTDSIFGVSWLAWEEAGNRPRTVQGWRTDTDLLRQTQGGTPLPAGELRIRRYCRMSATESTVLAHVEGGAPLLIRVPSDAGAVYFCSTLPTAGHSNLISQGVVFYVALQRAVASGASALSAEWARTCGTVPPEAAALWKPLDADSREIPPSRRTLTGGLYDTGDGLVALNRPLSEDRVDVVGEADLARIFGGLDVRQIRDDPVSQSGLASEIWRACLIVMILALLAEALLCLPTRAVTAAQSLRPAGAAFRTHPER